MNILKSLTILSAVTIISVLFINASKIGATPIDPQAAQEQTDNIMKCVQGITMEQENNILAVEQETLQSMQDANNANNADKNTADARKRAICYVRDEKIKTILSDDQYHQYITMEEANEAEVNKG